MKKVQRIIAIAALLLSFTVAPPAYAKGWEQAKTNREALRHVASDSELEIRAGGGVIYLTSSKPVNIKIFTILGSRIADDNLPAGSYQFAVPTHGVYLIKAGDITCKVAV